MIGFQKAQIIRAKAEDGWAFRRIARHVGVDPSTVASIANGTRGISEKTAHNCDDRKLARQTMQTVFGRVLTDLAPRQADVLRCILEGYQQGFLPAYKEIGEALGIRSPATIYRHVQALERKGYLIDRGQFQRLQLAQKAMELMR